MIVPNSATDEDVQVSLFVECMLFSKKWKILSHEENNSPSLSNSFFFFKKLILWKETKPKTLSVL